ncbi:MAG: hypothetical protein PG981_001479 [Wolbachia endosymbiont of Ctenocephalides orientis wCori]|nr:MAG: hypothetical protein PG981_001479 [Wolbachia endosymbiont of Ctenocephalides orientis wCori]
MAVNFGMTVEEIVSAVSNLSNIYGIKTNEMNGLGDTLNHLASNTHVEPKDMMLAIGCRRCKTVWVGLRPDDWLGKYCY